MGHRKFDIPRRNFDILIRRATSVLIDDIIVFQDVQVRVCKAAVGNQMHQSAGVELPLAVAAAIEPAPVHAHERRGLRSNGACHADRSTLRGKEP
jgi:hypothetical protein